MGVALSVCTLPGQVTSDRLGPGLLELGLGIVSDLKHSSTHCQEIDRVPEFVYCEFVLST